MNERLFLIICTFGLISTTVAEVRIWTSTTGKQLEAEYVGDAGDKVVLKTASGAKKRIPIAAFIKKDQEYVYNQKDPDIELEVSRGMKRSSVKGDIDDKRENFQFEMVVTEKKSRPYTKELTIELYVFGEDLYSGHYQMLDKQKQSFRLKGKSGSEHQFLGKDVRIQHDPNPGWGIKLKDYVAFVTTSDGNVLQVQGKESYMSELSALRKASTGQKFSRKMRPIN